MASCDGVVKFTWITNRIWMILYLNIKDQENIKLSYDNPMELCGCCLSIELKFEPDKCNMQTESMHS